MDTKSSSITVADLCDQFKTGNIIVNRSYQRTPKIWPAAARSYLIDTILCGYPIPKIALYQKIDLAKRKTIREIVDGQQRTTTIVDFYNDKLRISGKSKYLGKTFSQLDDNDQRRYLEYALSIDVFVGATEDDIRQVFRRMNSYTVPLNPEEKRHATFQGAFKWFIMELIEQYSEPLKQMGVLTEANISRMQDAKLFSEIIQTVLYGIGSAQDSQLNKLYQEFDEKFDQEKQIHERITAIIDILINCAELHNTDLMKSYNFYSLFTALYYCKYQIDTLREIAQNTKVVNSISDEVKEKLIELNEALEVKNPIDERQEKFIAATEKATNRKIPRETRFKCLVDILTI